MNQSSLLGLPATVGRSKQTQGQQANKSGRAAEAAIASMLTARGCHVQTQKSIGRGLYGTEVRVDFLVDNLRIFPKGLIIEVKWQDSAGSVDEKFPYLVANIHACYPCPAMVVYGGVGAKPGAIAWLRRQADGNKLFAVYSLEEFLSWTIRNL